MTKSRIARIAAICAVALVTAVSVGCASEPQAAAGVARTAPISVSCDEFLANHTISKDIQLLAGESVTVALCSNPTTGFQWGEAQIADSNIVTQTDRKFVDPSQAGGQPLLGAAGQDVWTFKAVKKGSTTISVSYGRPWEGGEKGEWTFNLTITVK